MALGRKREKSRLEHAARNCRTNCENRMEAVIICCTVSHDSNLELLFNDDSHWSNVV